MTPPIPLPFPYGIRIGTDICHIPRIARILAHRHGRRFIQRVLASEELASARPSIREVLKGRENSPAMPRAKPDVQNTEGARGNQDSRRDAAADAKSPGPDQGFTKSLAEAAVFLAGRYAAKEAVIKAHPHLARLSFRHIVIANAGGQTRALGLDPQTLSGPPVALVKTSELLGPGARDQTAMLSISHDGEYATAVCIGFDQRMAGGEERGMGLRKGPDDAQQEGME